MCGSTEHKNERGVEKLFSFSTLDRGSTVSAEHKNQPYSAFATAPRRFLMAPLKLLLECHFQK